MNKLAFDQIPADKFVYLPDSTHKKVLVLDMDETLIHCVDDID